MTQQQLPLIAAVVLVVAGLVALVAGSTIVGLLAIVAGVLFVGATRRGGRV